MTEKDYREIAKSLKPILWIGKNGITDALIEELKKLLKRKKIVKIKLLRSFLDDYGKKEAAETLAERSGSEIVSVLGFTVTLMQKPATRKL